MTEYVAVLREAAAVYQDSHARSVGSQNDLQGIARNLPMALIRLLLLDVAEDVLACPATYIEHPVFAFLFLCKEAKVRGLRRGIRNAWNFLLTRYCEWGSCTYLQFDALLCAFFWDTCSTLDVVATVSQSILRDVHGLLQSMGQKLPHKHTSTHLGHL